MQDSLPFAVTTDEAPGPRAELVDPARTVAFMLAGNAHVTFQSRKTGNRFTYRIEQATPRAGSTEAPPHFVSVLTGPDNGGDYQYLGCIFSRKIYSQTRKSKIATDAPSAVAFAWVWRYLSAGRKHPELAVWHEGRCGACNRRLTDPASIERGLGSTCAKRLGQ
jgi:hypothetical protein